MASEQPISVWGLLCILLGALIIGSALYQPFDPEYCVEKCGILGNLIPKLMGVLNSFTGPWLPRILYLGLGVLFVTIGWRARVPPKGGGADTNTNKQPLSRPMAVLAQIGGGSVVLGVIVLVYGFPISSLVVTGIAISVLGVLLVVAVVRLEKSRSTQASPRNNSTRRDG